MLAIRWLLLFFVSVPVFAFAQAQKGTIIADECYVYQEADFDAPVVATLRRGQVFAISKAKKGPFYKIRIKPGVTGWVSDAEIRPGVIKIEEAQQDGENAQAEVAAERSRRPYFTSRYRGITVNMLDYTEDTMGANRNASTMFYGVQFNGYNTLFSGDIYTETNLIFHSGAPKYYGEVTGLDGSGFIFMANFLFQTVLPRGKDFLFYYGFGPMFKYSHLDLQLPGSPEPNTYSADDWNLGAVFDVGLAFRFSRVSVRPDVKFYWEKSSYFGYGLSIGLDF